MFFCRPWEASIRPCPIPVRLSKILASLATCGAILPCTDLPASLRRIHCQTYWKCSTVDANDPVQDIDSDMVAFDDHWPHSLTYRIIGKIEEIWTNEQNITKYTHYTKTLPCNISNCWVPTGSHLGSDGSLFAKSWKRFINWLRPHCGGEKRGGWHHCNAVEDGLLGWTLGWKGT